MGSLSLWLGDMPRDFGDAKERRLARLRATCGRSREERLRQRESLIASVSDQIGAMTDRELLLVGVALYWAEGTKSKPWRIRDRMTFINSDPSVIAVFMRWLTLVSVSREGCHFRVSIHETADVRRAEKHWADLLCVDAATFNRATIKRHRPNTVRYNTGDDCYGCLVVDVLKSAELYRFVAGWWRGVSCGERAASSRAEPLG
jgi:hypothetical protein